MQAALGKALARDPAERYLQVADFIEDLAVPVMVAVEEAKPQVELPELTQEELGICLPQAEEADEEVPDQEQMLAQSKDFKAADQSYAPLEQPAQSVQLEVDAADCGPARKDRMADSR